MRFHCVSIPVGTLIETCWQWIEAAEELTGLDEVGLGHGMVLALASTGWETMHNDA